MAKKGKRADAENLTPIKKAKFISSLALLGTVGKAAEAVGIACRTVYDWKEKDPDFVLNVNKAYQMYGENILEREADRRAVEGVDEPVFYKGDVCGAVRKYSDTLLIFRMKGVMPDKYADRRQLSGPNGGPIPFSMPIHLGDEDEPL